MIRSLANLLRQLYKGDGLILALVIAIGAGLRLNGLFWDAPYFFNPDEKRLINWGMELDYFNPGVSEWGTLPLLVIKLIDCVLAFSHVPTQPDIYVVARGLSALLSCASIFLVYRLARKAYSKQTAIYGAVFIAFTVLHVQYSHFYSLDSVFAIFVLVALFPILDVAQTGSLKSYIFAGLSIGLTVAVRLNGWFLLAPLFIAHWCNASRLSFSDQENLSGYERWKRCGTIFPKSLASQKLLFALLLGVGTFVVLTPTSVLDPGKYLFHDGLVWVLLQSKGYLKSQYTLQFEGTSPWFYVSNLLFWAAGPFLLVAYGAGLIHSIFGWQKRANLIILSFLIIYFGLAAGSRVKFIRYCLPALPLLNIIAADFFASVQRVASGRPILRWGMASWLSLTIIGSGLYSVAFANIYSVPDTRIVAAQWIHDNIPPGSTIVHENDVAYAPPLGFYDQDRIRYRFREINFNYLYESSSLKRSFLPPLLEKLDVNISRRGKLELFAEGKIGPLSDQQKWQYLRDRLYCADYIIFSDRHYTVYRDRTQLFPVESAYYAKLFDGQLSFRPIKVFERKPGLLGRHLDDSQAELTFRIFDHPTVWIFQAQHLKEYLDSHPPQARVLANWSNWVRLVGYDIDQTVVRPGQDVHLTLYWEVLAGMPEDYTIFLQLQNDSHQIVAQNDYQVAEGLLPTSCWRPERIIKDSTRLPIPSDAPAGHHQLKLGLYFFETLERLAVVNDTSGENAVSLTDIRIIE